MINMILSGLLLVTGILGIVLSGNLIKKVMALNIINSSIVIIFIYQGSLTGRHAPIITGEEKSIVDPVPQALMLTAIVVGICVTALALVLVYRMYRLYGTLDINEIEKRIRDE